MQVPGILKKRYVQVVLIVVVGLLILNSLFFSKPKQEYVLAEVVKGDIVQTVSVTGSIKADPTIDLHFQKGGKIKEIAVKEGDLVVKDQLLASLENETLELEIQRMQANLDFARAQYEQTRAGAKYEEILIAEADVKSAQAGFDASIVALDNTKLIGTSNINISNLTYKQSLENKEAAFKEFENTKNLAEKEIANLELNGGTTQSVALDNAYNSVQSQLSGLFPLMQESQYVAEGIIGVRGTGYFLIDQSDKTNLKNNYQLPAQNDYNDAKTLYVKLLSTSTNEEIEVVLVSSLKAANSILLFLSQTSTVLENLPYDRQDLKDLITQIQNQSSALSNSTLKLQETQNTVLTLTTGSEQDIETLKLSYQLQIDAAQNKYTSAENALLEASHSLEQAKLNAEISNKNAEALTALKKAALDTARATLELRKSPARTVDLAPLSAQISQAEIALMMAEQDYKDSQIYAPINGKVTYVYGDIGENVSISETGLKSFMILNADALIVEANVPETDIVKIKNGDKVTMTIDAFDFTEKFEGEIIFIEPAETVIQGVIYYRIKAAITTKDERIRSGMTVNLEVETEKKTGVLEIPVRALKYEDSTKYVEILTSQGPMKVYVKTGIENDQFAELIEGLKEGDKVITFVK